MKLDIKFDNPNNLPENIRKLLLNELNDIDQVKLERMDKNLEIL